MTISDEKAIRLAREALCAGVALNKDAMAVAVTKIIMGGENATLLALQEWAEAVVKIMKRGRRGEQEFWIQAENEAGEPASLDEICTDQEKCDALRFIVMQGNKDHETQQALVRAYFSNRRYEPAIDMASYVLVTAATLARDTWSEDGH